MSYEYYSKARIFASNGNDFEDFLKIFMMKFSKMCFLIEKILF